MRKKISAVLSVSRKLAAMAACLALPAMPLFSQSLPFEDKARYEKALEQKVDEVLVRLLGPNQAKVIVDASMDFNRVEKLEVKSQPEKPAAAQSPFKWSPLGEAAAGGYLLPGFPSPEDARPAEPGEDKVYSRQVLYPAAFIKRMSVSIILNRELPDQASENVRQVVSELLLLDQKRGDQLTVIRSNFAPFWRTIWYTPEALKYIVLSVMGIIAMAVVAVGFLKLAGAMSNMARVQQSHQITMDLGKGAGPAGLDGPVEGLPGAASGQQALPAPAQEGPGAASSTLFNVSREQVPFLVHLMSSEEPGNVALVTSHLEPGVRAEFLKKLPQAFASEVVLSMARVRFVEPDIINTLKDELERRLGGAVGGMQEVLKAITDMDLRSRRLMIEELRNKQPELAAEVRRHILMPEDIGLFSERELSLMLGALGPEEWGAALFDLPEEVKERVKSQMPEKTWLMVEQSISYGGISREKTEEALSRIIAAASELIRDGRAANPMAQERALIAGEAASA